MMKLDAVLMDDFHGGYIALCPEIADCKVRGMTRDAALENLKKAVQKSLAPTMRIGSDLLSFRVTEQGPCAAAAPHGSTERAA